jgi:magnesium-transporting ATPase (P-type)
MVHFFALMLWVAGILAILAGMPQLGLAIFVVILLNGIFAFVQEYRAERASEKLRDLLRRRATVIRLIVLRAGDRISADVRLLEAFSLSIDTSTLTGESMPLAAQAGDTAYAGTFVVEGQGQGIVIATGSATRLAGVAQLAQAGRRPRTPLARELDRVVRIIAVASLPAGAVFLTIAALVGIRLTDAFLFALGVVVALVPEGLLPRCGECSWRIIGRARSLSTSSRCRIFAFRSVRIPGPGSRPSPDSPFRRDGSSDGGMDRAATAGGISVGQRAAFLTARPRPHLRF